jgi:hypothetical protein
MKMYSVFVEMFGVVLTKARKLNVPSFCRTNEE